MSRRDNILQQITNLAKQSVPQDSRVILFGSQARNTATQESDWDLLIILNKDKIEKSDYDNIAYKFTDLGWDLGESILPIMYTNNDWQKTSFSLFYKNVQHEGIDLLSIK